jgi:plasmid rolling circle replication initiator protein Rep
MEQSSYLFGEFPNEHIQRVSKLGNYKGRNMQFADWIEKEKFANLGIPAEFKNIVDKLNHCSDSLNFRNYYEDNKIILSRGNFCTYHTLCPICAINRAAKNVRNLELKTALLLEKNPSCKLYYAVLTVKNSPSLLDSFDKLHRGLKYLIAQRRYAISAKNGKKAYNFALSSIFADVIGGMYSLEIKRGKNSNLWHPHANILILADKELSENELSKEWQSITKDSFIVHLAEKKFEKQVFIEIAKYALKFSNMEFEDNFHAFRTLKGRRLIGTFGDMWGLSSEIEETKKQLNLENEDLPYLEMIYNYILGRSTYAPPIIRFTPPPPPKGGADFYPLSRSQVV